MIDSERLHAFSEGALIHRETPVEIVEVRGTRVLVREAVEPAEESAQGKTSTDADLSANANVAPDDSSPDDGGTTEPPLDFTVPQG